MGGAAAQAQRDSMRQYYVYILRCADGMYYTGVTNDVRRRFEEHAGGMDEDCYTFGRRPLELVHVMVFRYIRDAIACEKMIKAWGKNKKEALVRGDRQVLKLLSRKRFPRRYKRRQASERYSRVLSIRYFFRCAVWVIAVPRTLTAPPSATRNDKTG